MQCACAARVRQHRAAHLPSSSRSLSTAAEAVAAALLVSVRQLCAWCRLRPDNTYLLLDDFGENGAEDTGLTTELGVMSNEEEEHRDQQVRSCAPAHLLQRVDPAR